MLKKVFCVHCGRSTFVEFDTFAATKPAQPQPQDGGGCEPCPTPEQNWKDAFIKSDAHRHDLQIEADRLREEVKREQNLNRAYQENTQKLRQELNDEIARRNNLEAGFKAFEMTCEKLREDARELAGSLNREQETSKGLSVQVRDLENERTVLTFGLSEKQKTLDEARTAIAVELDNNMELKKQIRSVQVKLDEARAEINRLVCEPPKSKDAETIYDLRIELSQAQRQLTKIRSIANELEKQP